MFRVTNISGGTLVCTLADGKTTLRLKDGKHEDISEVQMTKYLRDIEKKKLVRIEDITPAQKTTAASAAEKEG